MAPRFVNPRTLVVDSIIVSRRQLIVENDGDEDVEESETANMTLDLIQSLNELVSSKMGTKRRKMADSSFIEAGDVALPFRLVSRSLPAQMVVLDPKPPPPVKSIPPEWEDTPADAVLRAKKSIEVAVSGGEILSESSRQIQSSTTASRYLEGAIPSLAGNLLLALAPQTPRTTRPPLPSCHSLPVSCAITLPPIPKAKCLIVETVDVVQHLTLSATQRRKARRIKLSDSKKPESEKKSRVALFWSPNSNLKGKCLGYAYGYPSSLHPHDFKRKTYRRDTMRKGVVEGYPAYK